MASRGLTALPNDALIAYLNGQMRDRFHYVGLIGSDSIDNHTLKQLLENTVGLTYHDVQRFVFAEFEASATYYDDEGVFTAVVDMSNDEGYDTHLYGVILMSDTRQIATVARTPIIYLSEQIGGEFPIKIPIKGEAGEIVYRHSQYLTLTEAEELFLLPSIAVLTLETQRITDGLRQEIDAVDGDVTLETLEETVARLSDAVRRSNDRMEAI